jgi:hypothetical protein
MTLDSDGTGTAGPDQEWQAVQDRWVELPRWHQAGIIALAGAEVALTAAAVVDLIRRPRARVRGPKALWFLALPVQPFGPIAYLTLGRRR